MLCILCFVFKDAMVINRCAQVAVLTGYGVPACDKTFALSCFQCGGGCHSATGVTVFCFSRTIERKFVVIALVIWFWVKNRSYTKVCPNELVTHRITSPRMYYIRLCFVLIHIFIYVCMYVCILERTSWSCNWFPDAMTYLLATYLLNKITIK